MCVAITVVQAAVVVALFALDHFAHSTAGANHHVYFKKLEYSQGVLDPGNLKLIALVAVLIAAICIVRLVLVARKRRVSIFWSVVAGILVVAAAAFLVACAFTVFFAEVLIWAYLIFAAMMFVLLAAIESYFA